jgi:hypothetical protein
MTDAMTGSLHAPKRNKYFYGKLLDVSHMQLEQCYGIEKRRLLNRLALGPGVLCGLGVTVGVDGTLCISPGVATDGCGREIVVPVAHPNIKPDQPTDALGIAVGDPLTGGQTTIYLCYTECDTERTEVYVSECDGVATTAPSVTEERYRVIVRAGVPDDEPPALTAEQRDAIFPPEPAADFNRRVAAEETLAITCAGPPECCVVLATVTLPEGDQPLTVDQYSYRSEVFSNTVLFELIAALADRVDACCAAIHNALAIAVTDGDNQTADVAQLLAAPVVLQVTDSDGNPASGAAVTVSTVDVDAALSLDNVTFAATVNATSDADGKVSVFWRLGSTPGAQSFTATLTGGASATAHATANQPPPANPPVVNLFEPKNGSQLAHDWADRPTIRVTFDQEMDEDCLLNPEPWLRVWVFHINADNFLEEGRRIEMRAGQPGLDISYGGDPIQDGRFAVVVMMRGSDPEIVAAASRLALDAEFQGTRLKKSQLDQLWNSGNFIPDAAFSKAVRDGGGALPSGDGTPGGEYFHAYFTVQPAP